MPRLNAKALEKRIDDYFRSCYGEPMVDEETGGVKLDKKGKPVASGKRPPTLSGLALAMGFASKADMLRYQGKPEVMTAIQRGRTRVEQYAEEKLFDKESSAGAKFVLEKDFGEAGVSRGIRADAGVRKADEAAQRLDPADALGAGGPDPAGPSRFVQDHRRGGGADHTADAAGAGELHVHPQDRRRREGGDPAGGKKS